MNWAVAAGIATVVALLVLAWIADRLIWRGRTRENLLGMLASGNWRYYKPAILELRRRGEDVGVHLPKIRALLASRSKVEQTAGRIIAKACFPELKDLI